MLAVPKLYDVSNVTTSGNAFTDILVVPTLQIKSFVQDPITKTPKPDQLAIDKAVQTLESEQSGEGIFDIATSVLKSATKVAAAWKAATTVGNIVRGPIGTKISNVLHRKYNKNPNWKPGFPGESHVVLPTPFSLTRANYAGPGTNLGARLARGDIGVDGPRGIDIAAKTHDILYSQARNTKDIRVADDRLIQAIRKSTAGPKTKALAVKMLQAKKFGEDVGVFGPETFTKLPGLKGKGRKELPAEMLKKKLRKQGYKFPRKGKHNLSAMGKRGRSQKGGQLAFLAGLAANLVVPAIIKAFKKK